MIGFIRLISVRLHVKKWRNQDSIYIEFDDFVLMRKRVDTNV